MFRDTIFLYISIFFHFMKGS